MLVVCNAGTKHVDFFTDQADFACTNREAAVWREQGVSVELEAGQEDNADLLQKNARARR